jgi:hypothetical protein
MGNINFDTNRFVETSSTTQISNGTMMFMDTMNPGVYYTANRNGNVNRIIKTNEQVVSTKDNQTTLTTSRKRTRYNRINYRQPNNGSFIPLHRLNDQLRRIQQVAENYNYHVTYTYTDSRNNQILVTPR